MVATHRFWPMYKQYIADVCRSILWTYILKRKMLRFHSAQWMQKCLTPHQKRVPDIANFASPQWFSGYTDLLSYAVSHRFANICSCWASKGPWHWEGSWKAWGRKRYETDRHFCWILSGNHFILNAYCGFYNILILQRCCKLINHLCK